jgi:hypothetical protein
MKSICEYPDRTAAVGDWDAMQITAVGYRRIGSVGAWVGDNKKQLQS